MVQQIINEGQAKHTASMIRMFNERVRVAELELVCLKRMRDELQDVLFEYRQRDGQHAGAEPT